MEQLTIRRATMNDIPVLDTLLYQVHKVHSDARPDLFKDGAKKYTDDELAAIIPDDNRPIFVAEHDGTVLGYAFCVREDHQDSTNLTDISTLYIDDLCVDENARGMHVGTALYEYVVQYARDHGYYNVTLNAWAANPAAVKFYEKLGMNIYKYGLEQIL